MIGEGEMKWFENFSSSENALNAAMEIANTQAPVTLDREPRIYKSMVRLISQVAIPGFNEEIFSQDCTTHTKVQWTIIQSIYDMNKKRSPLPHTSLKRLRYYDDRRLLLIEYCDEDDEGKPLMDFIKI